MTAAETLTADVVVCGAGIAGIAVANALATRHGVSRVLLVDDHAPLTLTTPIRDDAGARVNPTGPLTLADDRTLVPDTAVASRAPVRQAEAAVRARSRAPRRRRSPSRRRSTARFPRPMGATTSAW